MDAHLKKFVEIRSGTSRLHQMRRLDPKNLPFYLSHLTIARLTWAVDTFCMDRFRRELGMGRQEE